MYGGGDGGELGGGVVVVYGDGGSSNLQYGGRGDFHALVTCVS